MMSSFGMISALDAKSGVRVSVSSDVGDGSAVTDFSQVIIC